jgi:hypothetical protein
MPQMRDALALGRLVEPAKNIEGLRRVGVRVGYDVKMDWRNVELALTRLVEKAEFSSRNDERADEWYRQYEEIHPFVDGNGRTGSLLYCWLRGLLLDPVHPPDWDDPAAYWGTRSAPSAADLALALSLPENA